jgi:hypothetical protein
MQIDQSKAEESNQFIWKYQNTQIDLLKENLRTQPRLFEKLEKTLIYIDEDAAFKPIPASELIK